jgi:hypothetical protein
MKPEQIAPPRIEIIQGKPIEQVLRRAVRHALLQHKRAGNTVATWQEGRVVLIPAAEIRLEAEEHVAQDED